MSFRRIRAPVKTPLIKKIVEIQNREQISDNKLMQRAGLSQGTWSRVRNGMHTPNLLNFEAVVNALGYRLVLEKIPNDQTTNNRRGSENSSRNRESIPNFNNNSRKGMDTEDARWIRNNSR